MGDKEIKIGPAGGSSTLTTSCTYQYRNKYASGTYGSWTNGSIEPTIYNVSQPTGFSRNGKSVTVAGNSGNSARSAQYGAKVNLDKEYTATPCTITQAGDPDADYDDGFEWADTEITVDAGGTATATFYCSTQNPSITQYSTNVLKNAEITQGSVRLTGASNGWKYTGTATIIAKPNTGGQTAVVTGSCAGINDELKVKVPLKVVSMIISGISEYSTPMYATFKATVTLNNGTVHTSDSHPSRFSWNDQENDFELLEDNGFGVFALPGQGKSGYVWCYYSNGSVYEYASHYVKFVEYNDTYTFVAARLVLDRTENGYDYYHVDIKCKNQNNVERIFQVEGNTFEVNGVDALLSWDCVEGGLWNGCTNVVPAGTTIRVGLTVNGVNRGYVGLTW